MKHPGMFGTMLGLVVAFGLAAGCRHSELPEGDLPVGRLGRLNLGMPKEDALELLGEPEAVATREVMYQGDWKTHEYWRFQDGSSATPFVVAFRDAAVVGYGPMTGDRTFDLEGLFEDSEESAHPAVVDGAQPTASVFTPAP